MKSLFATLYFSLFLIANAVGATEADKLQVYDAPRPPVLTAVADVDGQEMQFGASDKDLRIVNLWALWCVACRKEMPTLDELAKSLDAEKFAFAAVAVGRNDPAKVDEFLGEIGVKNLPIYYDAKQRYATSVGAAALPYTIFLNKNGEEIARVIGEANYLDEGLVAKIKALAE